jgi:hypothetical protein
MSNPEIANEKNINIQPEQSRESSLEAATKRNMRLVASGVVVETFSLAFLNEATVVAFTGVALGTIAIAVGLVRDERAHRN